MGRVDGKKTKKRTRRRKRVRAAAQLRCGGYGGRGGKGRVALDEDGGWGRGRVWGGEGAGHDGSGHKRQASCPPPTRPQARRAGGLPAVVGVAGSVRRDRAHGSCCVVGAPAVSYPAAGMGSDGTAAVTLEKLLHTPLQALHFTVWQWRGHNNSCIKYMACPVQVPTCRHQLGHPPTTTTVFPTTTVFRSSSGS